MEAVERLHSNWIAVGNSVVCFRDYHAFCIRDSEMETKPGYCVVGWLKEERTHAAIYLTPPVSKAQAIAHIEEIKAQLRAA